MALVRGFGQIGKDDAAIAGGKGASLGEMTQAGIPVPPGFVILADTFERFIEETDLIVEIDAILATVNHEEMHTVEHASEKIQGLILAAQMPEDIKAEIMRAFKELDTEFVAVRSSATAEDGATAAWAGQLDTYLNTTEADLLEKVQECWASLFTPRAIFYRFEKGLHTEKISVAVVVQKMVNSDAAGIAFSVHPVTEDRNQLIIEAGFGLGEAVVSGQITPDSYVVTKEPRKILDKNLAEQERGLFRKEGGGNEWRQTPEGKDQVLTDEQILGLSETVIGIEKHYGFPCDIEWAMEGDDIFITQSRPITTLSQDAGPADSIPDRETLVKIFSREKPLLYFQMWNDSDRMGFKDFLGHEVRHSVFLIPGSGSKGSVWYQAQELEEIDAVRRKSLTDGSDTISRLIERLDTHWTPLMEYLSGQKLLTTADDLEDYYRTLVTWWSAMTVAFDMPDMEEMKEKDRDAILSRRAIAEKWTEAMSKLMVAFWNERFPDLEDLSMFVTPGEAVSLARNRDESLVSLIRERSAGCALIDEAACLGSDIERFLEERGLAFASESNDGLVEFTGAVAFKGKARGRVRIIGSFADMAEFVPGEILVTEMTNPDYVPIMKIASAVVTDEGGMTCHAAIASRELKVPCVVGTRIATQVLKDGDMVEVNADTGTVRILEEVQTSAEGKKMVFTKPYERDFTLALEEYWARGFLGHLLPKLGLASPFPVFEIFFVTEENLQIWEHDEAIGWMHDRLLELNQNGTAFMESVLAEYLPLLDRIKEYWANGPIADIPSLEAYVELIKVAAPLFSLWYYPGTDERTPEDVRKLVMEIRTTDEFFARNDVYIKDCIVALGGKREHANLVLCEEFPHLPSPETLEVRAKGIVSVDGKERFCMPLKQFAKEHPEYEFKGLFDAVDAASQVTGQVAQNGIVRGKVCIVKNKRQMEDVESGDIIISPMTTPDFLPAMQRAAAFVTDEGGIMCHAAIVAREMKKPCVIGTKIATRIFKNGDMVEVDANTGIVRILS